MSIEKNVLRSGKTIVFTDFFDTIMFRHSHPLVVADRWCKLISNIYGIDIDMVAKARRSASKQEYTNLYTEVYRQICDNGYNINCSIETFIDKALNIETACEIGIQYPNKQYIAELKNLKDKGLQIYIVSDFHLPKSSFEKFLLAKNIQLDLFDGIYISNDLGSRKSNGTLFQQLLKNLKIDAGNVVMIGDNKAVDGANANNAGIESIVIPNYCEKIKGQIQRRLGLDYSKRAFRAIREDCYEYNSPYCEYSLLFYLTCRELFNELQKTDSKNVSFLAREGHFLRRAFTSYQDIIAKQSNRIKDSYVKCSRRAAQSTDYNKLIKLSESEISLLDWLYSFGFDNQSIAHISEKFSISNQELSQCKGILKQSSCFLKLTASEKFNDILAQQYQYNLDSATKYFELIPRDEVLNIVDIGWRGHMQETIGSLLKTKTQGYYLGLNVPDITIENKKGLIFSYCPEFNFLSKYSNILKANIQLYEQLTAAPHGSALGYYIDNEGNPCVKEDWAENEKYLYENIVERKQRELLLITKGLIAWCDELPYRDALSICAKTVLRSSLIADRNRLDFLKALDSGFIWNFNKQTKGLKYKASSVKVGLDILYAPERYTRYFAKIQRSLQNRSKIIQKLYIPFAWCLYGYIWSIAKIKN